MGFTARARTAALQAAVATGKPRVSHSSEFTAMGTLFGITVVDCDVDVLGALETRVHRMESAWTRFSDSELMRANNNPGVAQAVSEDTLRLVRAMARGWELTNGLFDPNVLGDMIDRGMAESRIDPSRRTEWTARVSGGATFADVVVDESAGTLLVPPGVGLDPGGVGKGLAADLVVDLAMGLGARGACVFAGGDVRVAGLPPAGDAWYVEVEDHADPEAVLDTLVLDEGGLATSSPSGWTTPQGNHYVNRGGADHGVAQVTVACGSAADAEVLTKACLALPPGESIALVERLGAEVLLVLADGGDVESAGWGDLCE